MQLRKGTKRRALSAIVAAVAISGWLAPVASAQQPLYWGPGEDTAVVRGSITGDQFSDYSFSAKGGTGLEVELNAANLSLNFNIIEANSAAAIKADPSPVSVRSWKGTIPQSGNYRIRLYLLGAARDEGKTVEFTLTVKKTRMAGGGGGGTGGGGDDYDSVNFLDYKTGGSGEYTVDDSLGTRTVKEVRVLLQEDNRARIDVGLGGDGFTLHGTWAHGDGPEIKITLTHGYSGSQLDGWGTLTLRGRTEFSNIGLRFKDTTQKLNCSLTFTAARG